MLPSVFVWLVVIFPFAGALLTPLLAKLEGRVRDYAAVVFSVTSKLANRGSLVNPYSARIASM